MNTSDRLVHLRAYLLQLGHDKAREGAFRVEGENVVEAYAAAAIQGGGAMAAQLAADLKALAGEAIAIGQPIVENLIAGAADRAVRAGFGKVVDAAADLVTGRAERREVGKAFMNAAQNLGKRRGGRP